MSHAAKSTDLLGMLKTVKTVSLGVNRNMDLYHCQYNIGWSGHKSLLDFWLKMASLDQTKRRMTFWVLNKVTIFGNIFYQAVS